MLTKYKDRDITFRLPYSLVQEVIVLEGERAICAEFVHRVDKIFHLQEITVTLTALDTAGAVIDPQPSVLDSLLSVEAINFSMNERLGDQVPFRRLGHNSLSWSPRSNLFLIRSEGFQVYCHGNKSFAIAKQGTPVKAIVAKIALEGENLVLAPPGYVKTQEGLK